MNASENQPVSLVKTQSPGEGAVQALSMLERRGVFTIPSGVVFIKPNIVVPIPFNEAPSEISDPDILGALIRHFYERGARKVIVGESPAWGASCSDAYRTSGVEQVVRDNHAELCDLDETPYVWKPIDGHVFKEMKLPRAMLEADLIVNLPKAKTHFLAGVTVGVKNLFGCLKYEDRKKFHRDFDLAYVLADLLKALAPGLTVVDAVKAMEGFGPHGGPTVELNAVVAGTDTIAVDSVTTALMGIDPSSIGFLQVSQKLGLGRINLAEIEVVGSTVEEIRQTFLPPVFQYVSRYENVSVFAGGICPGCMPRIPVVPTSCDPSKQYAIIIGREPIAIRPDVEADEFWLVGNCGVKAGMACLLRNAFIGNGSNRSPKVVKLPGCPPLDWFSQKVIFPPLREKGWMD
jgi:uncharacterized protein (DUF362 family)